MALPNLGTLSLGPASTGAEVRCRHFGEPVSAEEELELAFKRFKAVQELREQNAREGVSNEPPNKKVNNHGILSDLQKSVNDDSDDDPLLLTSLALGYQRHVDDSWSKAFDDDVQCPESWTTPGPASIIRMRNYNWCYPGSNLDDERAQSYMLKASLFVDLTQQRRAGKSRKTFPADYINRITSDKFYGSDTEDILDIFLAECATYTFTTTNTRPLYEDNTFPPARGENAPDDSDDDMQDFVDFRVDEEDEEDEDEELARLRGISGRQMQIFDTYYSRRQEAGENPLSNIQELQHLTASARDLWNVPWEKRLGLPGRGRITREGYTFWTADEYKRISDHIHFLLLHTIDSPYDEFFLQEDTSGDTEYTDGELAFKGPTTMNYTDSHPNGSLYWRSSHPGFDHRSFHLAPEHQSAIDCLDISVHVPIEERVNLNDRTERSDGSSAGSCKIDRRSLAYPGTGRDAIVIVRPYSYRSENLGDNEPLHTDVFAGNPPNAPQTRENIFLQWLQQNELRRWGVARTSDGEVNRNLGWYSDFRDSYEFRHLVATPASSILGSIFDRFRGNMTNTSAVAKVPGANVRDVMVTEGGFYNAEVGEVLPSTLSNLPAVHKVPQGLAFFVGVNIENGEDQDPCRYVEAIMNQCLRRGSEGQDHGCIAWLLDEMGKTPGYEAMAKAEVLYSDNHWVSQSTHMASTKTPYERQTGIQLTNFRPASLPLDPDEGPDHSGGIETSRFTAGCKLGFGIVASDHYALHGGDGAATAQRRRGVETARATLRADWTAARA
jgi:hypothetical protein